ncbi:MAG: hypothetical protein ACOC5K_02020 [Chloroflexota bacterium]
MADTSTTPPAPSMPVGSVAPAGAAAESALPPVIDDGLGDAEKSVDIETVYGGAGTSLELQIQFSDGTPMTDLAGYILLDTDQDAETGMPAEDFFGLPAQDVGAEYVADASRISEGTVTILSTETFAVAAEVSSSIDGNRVSFSVPLSALGEDDGAVNIAMALGDGGPSDWAPDEGHGTVEPVRSATPFLRPHQDSEAFSGDAEWDGPEDDATGVLLGIEQITDMDGNPVDAQVASYQAELTYSPTCVEVLDFREGPGFEITGSTIDPSEGIAEVSGESTSGEPAPATMAFALVRLVDSVEATCSLEAAFDGLTTADGVDVDVDGESAEALFQRGDVRRDGTVDIADALFSAQYLAGLRDGCQAPVLPGGSPDLTCADVVNMASVKQDGEFDRPSISDALFIAQYLADLRDEFME